MKKTNVRLPNHVQAQRYEITLKPDLEAFVFEGHETIHLTITKAVKNITLHSKDLEITSVEYIGPKKEFWAGKISYNTKAETVTVSFPKTIPIGKGKLRLVFRGVLGDTLRGYYRSKYSVDGKTKYLAVTQFEATDARRAFPCFDEPAHKAIFDVTMIVPDHHEAISNTLPVDIREHSAGFKAVRFAPTPKMSTYLLAFISGEFEKIEKKTKDGVLVRIFTTKGKIHQGKFPLDVAVKTLEFFTEYFNIAYPLPVLDMIAIPDFAAGAMENWGAVTYRETQFLVDEVESSASTKQWAAITVAHELAHQWFGNLVTMEWWTHLWLNEGFASYIEYLAVDHIFPEWNMWTQFAYLDFGSALDKDSLADTHPIEVEVHHPDEIGEIFDGISYHKGASVIRMLAAYLGEDDFRKGLQKYLKRHAYANAATNHLWQAFEEVSKKPVRKIMAQWTKQTGFPLISVDKQGKQLRISQTRFFANPKAKPDTKTAWPVPLSINPREPRKLIVKKEQRFTYDHDVLPNVNPELTSFCRVVYPSEMWRQLAEQVRTKELSTLDRLGVVTNALALAGAGKLDTKFLLELISSYEHETDYTVWVEVLSALGTVYTLSHGTPHAKKIEKVGSALLKKIGMELGFKPKPGEAHTTGMLRAIIMQSFASYGDSETRARAFEMFGKAQKKLASVPADLRSPAYNIAARYGGKKTYDVLMQWYIRERSAEEKGRLGRALAVPRDPALLTKTLEFSISKHVRIQDITRFTDGVGRNPIGGPLLWAFLKENWGLIIERYGQGGHMLSRIVEGLSGNANLTVAKDIRNFFKKNPAPGAERTIKQVLEQIEINALWKTRIAKHLH